jgi:formate C-acetyltransferase
MAGPQFDLATLKELGEWAALGFYEGLDAPWPRPFGLAFRRLYENMPINLAPDRCLLPDAPFYPLRHCFTKGGAWCATALVCDFDHNRGLRVNTEVAEEKKREFPQHAAFLDAFVADLKVRLPHFGGYTHSNPDMRRVVGEGFLAMERELEGELAAVRSQGEGACAEELNLLLALQDYAAGVRAFHTRAATAISDLARRAADERRARLEQIAAAFAEGFLRAARTFLQGLLAVHFTWLLDGCDSIGRPDQVLGALFEKDLAAGTLDLAFARGLLDELFQQFERFNGWNMQIGGRRPDGRDGCNALTRECLAACGRNRQRRPNVALRLTRETPLAALTQALEVLREGAGRPALYNDDLYIETLARMDLGLSVEDAREIGFGGCTETMIAGLSNVGSLEGEINLAKALELALHDGYDPVAKAQGGPHTGRFEDFADFASFLGAVRRQIQYATDAFVAQDKRALRERFGKGDPKLYRTFFTRDCVRRHKSFEGGGARYNWCVVSYQGIANLVDSLAALKSCVFDEKLLAAREVLDALDADFAERADVLRTLRAAPKFGNDIEWVDGLGSETLRFAWETLYQHQPPRGGRYIASCILFATYAGAGRTVGALPDGRRALEPLADSVGPVAGRDTRGPTAALNSVAALPLTLAAGTPVLNLRFQKALLQSQSGLRKVGDLIRAFFAKGGMQAQVSVLSREEMLAAQAEPEKHGDLLVRIGGYSEYFCKLSRPLQDSVIARTEYTA